MNPTPESREPETAPLREALPMLAAALAIVLAAAAGGWWWTTQRPPRPATDADLPRPAARQAAPPPDRAAARPAGAASEAAAHEMGSEEIENAVKRLAARLEKQPDDADGWAMLARTYVMTRRHAQALPAFERAAKLRADDPVLLADYADALAMSRDRKLAGEPMALVQRALKLDPNNLKALSLAGTEAFDRKDYAQAIVHWEKLRAVAPADSVFVQQIAGGIDEARRLAGAAPGR